MTSFARGAAFVDRSGVVLGADDGFTSLLGLEGADATSALRARAEADPALRALLAGAGPGTVSIAGAAGDLTLERVPGDGGALLVVRSPGASTWLEEAMRAQALGALAAGLAHDVKNPLNAMALQLALLTEKLAAMGDAAPAADSNLGALRDQIGRVNEVVRRYLDVAEPSSPLGYTDLGALVSDAAHLFGHDARRKRVELVTADARAGAVRTRADAARVGRVMLGLVFRALVETPEGGRLELNAAQDGGEAVLSIEHSAGDPVAALEYYTGVASAAARALEGSLSIARGDGVERIALRLPRNDT